MSSERHPPTSPDQTTTKLIWDGVEATRERAAELQPAWEIPETIVIKADIGHHHQAEDVIAHSIACADAGACSLHLHIRDEDGNDTGDIGLWREVVGALRSRLGDDIVIDSGLRGSTMQERLSHIRERLFDIVPLLPTWDADYLARPLGEMRAHGVAPEICVWDGTDISIAKSRLLDTGLIERPAMWLLVPGTPFYGIPMPSPELMARGAIHMVELIREADPEAHVSFSAAGRASSYLTTLGTMLGHHLRPGIGETHWRWPHSEDFADDPATLISDAVEIAWLLGREPASAAGFREMVGLGGGSTTGSSLGESRGKEKSR